MACCADYCGSKTRAMRYRMCHRARLTLRTELSFIARIKPLPPLAGDLSPSLPHTLPTPYTPTQAYDITWTRKMRRRGVRGAGYLRGRILLPGASWLYGGAGETRGQVDTLPLA